MNNGWEMDETLSRCSSFGHFSGSGGEKERTGWEEEIKHCEFSPSPSKFPDVYLSNEQFPWRTS